MKIAVFGFYNARNAGDDRIRDVIVRLLADRASIVFLPHYEPPCPRYLSQFDWVLIGGGGLVFERVGIWRNLRRWVRRSGVRLGVIGLGVNHVPDDLRPELEDLVSLAEFITVRDQESRELLRAGTRASVFPDLTWMYPLRRSTISGEQLAGVALNLCPCYWRVFDPDAWMSEMRHLSLLPFPLNFRAGQDRDLLTHYFGENVPYEFCISPLSGAKLLIGARYHSVVFALQMGVPCVAIAYDVKVRRLMDEAGLGELCLETDRHDDLRQALHRIEERRDEIITKIDRASAAYKERGRELRKLISSRLGVAT